MHIIKPKKLKKGDLIGIVSPASSPADLSRIEKGVKYLESLGYRVETGKNVGKYYGYLAGNDEERLEDIHYMFGKKDVKAIICVRGGYGTPRLLDKIDYKLIRNNPKIFVGYSDITAIQLAFFTRTGLVTFAGPMLAVDFYDEINPFTEEMFWTLLTSNKKLGKIKLPDNEKLFHLIKGNAKGRVLGGNLATVCSLIGTNYFPDMKKKILILEETGEPPYRIDRMLSQLRLNNVLSKVSGIIFGAFIDCAEHDHEKKTLTLGEVIDDYIRKLKIPVIYNFRHGHVKDNITIPLGLSLRLNASRNYVEITENAVS
jgi:muramoyltetrapeptide carboxypeptidase